MPARPSQPDPVYLTPLEMRTALLACAVAKQPVCIHGPVGIGKSQTVAQFVESIGASWQLEPISRRDPTDYSGVPMPDTSTRQTIWCEPAFFASARDNANAHPAIPHIIFWDEYNRAPPAVQNVTLNIILENRSGEFVLPANVLHILAVNDAQDSTAVTGLSEASRNRVVHLYMRSDLDSFQAWAKGTLRTDLRTNAANACAPFAFAQDYAETATGMVRHEIISYLGSHPDALHAFDRHADAFPTPRSWTFVSRVLDPALPPNVERALICGSIGVPHGGQFWSHLALVRTLAGKFDVPRIIANPTTEPIPTDVSALYAVASALSRLMTPQNGTAVMQYVARLPGEFQAFVVLGAIRRTGTKDVQYTDSPMHNIAAVNAWKIANQDMF